MQCDFSRSSLSGLTLLEVKCKRHRDPKYNGFTLSKKIGLTHSSYFYYLNLEENMLQVSKNVD